MIIQIIGNVSVTTFNGTLLCSRSEELFYYLKVL